MCLFTHARLPYGPGEGYTSDKEMPRDLTDLDTRLFTVRTLLSSPSNLEFQEDGLNVIHIGQDALSQD